MALMYAVITPARDEEEHLRRLGDCLAGQTITPCAWNIVENGSSDRTPELAHQLATEREWVHVLTLPGSLSADRGAPVVRALQAGIAALVDPPELVVNIDADITMEPDYFERLLERFHAQPALGIASGSLLELHGGVWRQRHLTGTTVVGGCRAYRWECLQEILPLDERVGWDGIDEFKANSLGWRTKAFEELPFRHHRPEGQRDGSAWQARRNQGIAAHYLYYRPWYLVLRSLWQARREPAALAMIWGYAQAALARGPRMEDEAARAYLRRQQSIRLLPLRAAEAAGRRRRVSSGAD
jgi:glycosyltransferase involved in cell wall biosynthesis